MQCNTHVRTYTGINTHRFLLLQPQTDELISEVHLEVNLLWDTEDGIDELHAGFLQGSGVEGRRGGGGEGR